MTGPNTSFWMISSSCCSPSTTLASKKKPRAAGLVAAGQHPGVVGQPVDEPGDPVQLGGVVQRPEVGVRRCPGRPRSGRAPARPAPPPGRRGRRGPASTRVAAVQSWPALKYPATAIASAAAGHVRVVEHDDRRLAAQFQVDPLEVTGGRDGDLLARPHAAGDRHHLRDRVGDQCPAGVPVTADHVEHARRQELAHQFGHEQRGDRRGVGRLEHHGVARPRAPGPTSTPPSSSGSSTA